MKKPKPGKVTKKAESTRVDFPDEWTDLQFVTLQSMALGLDDVRLSTSMQLAVLVRYIHDQERYKEEGHETFEEWCESIDRTKQWGHYLVKAADHAARVGTPYHARALSGLPDGDADAVVSAAKAAGPVTAAALTDARTDLERRRADALDGDRRANQAIDEGIALRKFISAATKAKAAAQQHGGFPEECFEDLEKWIEWAKDQQLAA